MHGGFLLTFMGRSVIIVIKFLQFVKKGHWFSNANLDLIEFLTQEEDSNSWKNFNLDPFLPPNLYFNWTDVRQLNYWFPEFYSRLFAVAILLHSLSKAYQNDVVLLFLLLTLNIFHTFFYCFYYWLWTSKC